MMKSTTMKKMITRELKGNRKARRSSWFRLRVINSRCQEKKVLCSNQVGAFKRSTLVIK